MSKPFFSLDIAPSFLGTQTALIAKKSRPIINPEPIKAHASWHAAYNAAQNQPPAASETIQEKVKTTPKPTESSEADSESIIGLFPPSATGEGFFGKDGLTVDDLIDLINPLHHIPVLGGLYREITGDTIAPGPRLIPGFFTGPLSLAGKMFMLGIEENTGKSVGRHITESTGLRKPNPSDKDFSEGFAANQTADHALNNMTAFNKGKKVSAPIAQSTNTYAEASLAHPPDLNSVSLLNSRRNPISASRSTEKEELTLAGRFYSHKAYRQSAQITDSNWYKSLDTPPKKSRIL